MLRNIVRKAVEAAFSTYELEVAVADLVECRIDYDEVAEEVLKEVNLDDIVQEVAVEYALDILDLP